MWGLFWPYARSARPSWSMPALLAQCAAFPQYAVAERDDVPRWRVASQVVAANRRDHRRRCVLTGLLPRAFDAVEPHGRVSRPMRRSRGGSGGQAARVSCWAAGALGDDGRCREAKVDAAFDKSEGALLYVQVSDFVREDLLRTGVDEPIPSEHELMGMLPLAWHRQRASISSWLRAPSLTAQARHRWFDRSQRVSMLLTLSFGESMAPRA